MGYGEDWTPEKRGRALVFVSILASTPPEDWRSKRELHKALQEFVFPETLATTQKGETG